MNLLVKLSVVPIFFLPLIAGWAGTQEESKVVEQPPVKPTEAWQITVGGPGWLAGVSGTTGFHGINSNINVSVGQILRNINVIYSMISATRTSSISFRCMERRSQSGLTFRSRVEICDERSLAAGWRTLGDRLSRRLWLLQGEALLTEARRRTGLEDFGNPPIEPALSILVKSLELEADLHPLGRFLMRVHLRDCSRLDCGWPRRGAGGWSSWSPRSYNGPCSSPACREAVPLFCTSY